MASELSFYRRNVSRDLIWVAGWTALNLSQWIQYERSRRVDSLGNWNHLFSATLSVAPLLQKLVISNQAPDLNRTMARCNATRLRNAREFSSLVAGAYNHQNLRSRNGRLVGAVDLQSILRQFSSIAVGAKNWFFSDCKLHPTMTPQGNALIDCINSGVKVYH